MYNGYQSLDGGSDMKTSQQTLTNSQPNGGGVAEGYNKHYAVSGWPPLPLALPIAPARPYTSPNTYNGRPMAAGHAMGQTDTGYPRPSADSVRENIPSHALLLSQQTYPRYMQTPMPPSASVNIPSSSPVSHPHHPTKRYTPTPRSLPLAPSPHPTERSMTNPMSSTHRHVSAFPATGGMGMGDARAGTNTRFVDPSAIPRHMYGVHRPPMARMSKFSAGSALRLSSVPPLQDQVAARPPRELPLYTLTCAKGSIPVLKWNLPALEAAVGNVHSQGAGRPARAEHARAGARLAGQNNPVGTPCATDTMGVGQKRKARPEVPGDVGAAAKKAKHAEVHPGDANAGQLSFSPTQNAAASSSGSSCCSHATELGDACACAIDPNALFQFWICGNWRECSFLIFMSPEDMLEHYEKNEACTRSVWKGAPLRLGDMADFIWKW